MGEVGVQLGCGLNPWGPWGVWAADLIHRGWAAGGTLSEVAPQVGQ